MDSKLNIARTVFKMFLFFRSRIELKEESIVWEEMLGHLREEDSRHLVDYRAQPEQPDLQDLVIDILTRDSERNEQLYAALEKYGQVIRDTVNWHRLGEERQARPSYSHMSFGGTEPATIRKKDELVSCFFQAEMESPVLINSIIAITFNLSRERLEATMGKETDKISAVVLPDQPLILQCRPVKNFTVFGPDTIEVRVPEEGQPETVIFNGKCTQTGQCALAIDVWQGQLLLCTLTLHPECIGSRAAAGICSTRAAGILMKPLKRPVHQLRITERTEGDGIYYTFYFESPQLGIYDKYESARINGSKDSYLQSLYTEIDALWTTAAGDAKEVEKMLREIGSGLFSSLIPPGLQQVLWNNRDKICSMMLVSEEPSIPWELLLVKDPGRKAWLPEDKFLSEMGLVRWLYGWQPAEELILNPGKVRTVIPDYLDRRLRLPAAAAERQFLETLLGARAVSPLPDDVRDILRKRNGFDLLHFTCHGMVDMKSARSAKLILQDQVVGGELIPSYLSLISVQQIDPFCVPGDFRPTVVLNACQAAMMGQQLVGFGGFASAFLNAGAGIFVGALWSIEDDVAFTFMKTWYESLLSGKTLSEATVEARQAAKLCRGATYVSYVVYGHPEAVLSIC